MRFRGYATYSGIHNNRGGLAFPDNVGSLVYHLYYRFITVYICGSRASSFKQNSITDGPIHSMLTWTCPCAVTRALHSLSTCMWSKTKLGRLPLSFQNRLLAYVKGICRAAHMKVCTPASFRAMSDEKISRDDDLLQQRQGPSSSNTWRFHSASSS